jgi:hypothetical protein
MNDNHTSKAWCLAAALLFLGMPLPSHGQQTNELEGLKSTIKSLQQTIEEMNRKIAELEKQQKASPPAPATPLEKPIPGVPPPTHPGQITDQKVKSTPPAADLSDGTVPMLYQDTVKEDELAAPRPGNAPLDPSYQGFMQLFGTKTWVRLGGYAKVDAIVDSTKVGNPNFFVTGKIPVEGEADFGKDEQFALHAKQTRLNLELRSPTDLGSLKIYYENDFFGNSDQPSMDYRLRHFYGQIANITVGQTWSTFYDPDANPDTLDFEGPGSLPVMRQPELRYTLPLIKNRMYMAFAVEQPKSDVGNLPATADGRNTMPDFVSNWRMEGKSGHVQVAGVLRALSYNNSAGPEDTTMGWGLNLAGARKVWKEDTVMASVSYGDGIGRYIQDLPSNSAAIVDASGDLHTLTAWGAMIGYRHQWAEHWRSTASYSYVQLDNRSEQGAFAYDKTHYAQGNLVWAPTKNFYVGIEYLYGFKEARNGNTGDDHRVQLSLQYKLVR